MSRALVAASILLCTATQVAAQGFDLANAQIHGYATQSFIYSTNDNWNTTSSTDGSPAWTEAVVNLTAQPKTKLRIGVQARYFLLGEYGNKVTLDWAQADFKVSEYFGIRAGKVKSPLGLFNEIQDIDPAYLWILLPQSIYPIVSRNAVLSHYGGVAYGTVPLGEAIGKLEYRGFGGERTLASEDGFFTSQRDLGITFPNGLSGPTFGGSLRWKMPIKGMLFGASETAGGESGEMDQGPSMGHFNIDKFRQTFYFGKYEHQRFMFAGEYSRQQALADIQFPGLPPTLAPYDVHSFYLMSSYRLLDKLNAGFYHSSTLNRKAPFNSARYQKDWALTARYDFNPYLYAKVEQHFIEGTEVNYSTLDNVNLQPTTRMTLLKLGVIF